MRKIIFICLAVLLCELSIPAESFQLLDGRTVTGEVLSGSATDAGLQIRVDEGQYERVPWASFTQEDLKKFQQTPKLAALVEPFVEVSQAEKLKKTEVTINPVPRLERPPHPSLVGAMFSSGLGLVILLLLYVANLFAAFEVAIFRSRPVVMVCGAAALLPVIGPIIFLCLPGVSNEPTAEEEAEPAFAPAGTVARAANTAAAAAAAAATATTTTTTAAAAAESPLSPDPAQAAPNPGGLHIHHAEAASSAAALPATQIFQRGAFTFNRRFLETKFAGFFGVVRRDAEKDMLLVIKSARGEYHGTRISRITGNDLHLQVVKGGASEEVLIPFTEIKEIQLKHKDAP